MENCALLTQISNPNLLDNPWFTVNQRGESSYALSTGSSYTADRWLLSSGSSTCSVALTDSIGATFAITSYVGYVQLQNRLDPDFSAILDGQTVTLSAIVDDTLYSTTFEYTDSENTTKSVAIDEYLSLQFRNIPADGDSGHIIRLISSGTGSYNIRAVKLEVGSVSTLALDTAPNYATELLKCQRYYHIYATQSLRPSNMYDCVPVMASTPSQGTITIDSTTYYYNSADL